MLGIGSLTARVWFLKIGLYRVIRIPDVIIRAGTRLLVVCGKHIDGRGPPEWINAGGIRIPAWVFPSLAVGNKTRFYRKKKQFSIACRLKTNWFGGSKFMYFIYHWTKMI